jgi:hypothetical protein
LTAALDHPSSTALRRHSCLTTGSPSHPSPNPSTPNLVLHTPFPNPSTPNSVLPPLPSVPPLLPNDVAVPLSALPLGWPIVKPGWCKGRAPHETNHVAWRCPCRRCHWAGPQSGQARLVRGSHPTRDQSRRSVSIQLRLDWKGMVGLNKSLLTLPNRAQGSFHRLGSTNRFSK